MDTLPFNTPDVDEPPSVYVRVAVERGFERPGESPEDATFTYRSADADLRPGERVEVPLGRGNRTTGGIVVAVGGPDLLDGFPPERVKPISARTGRALTPALVELARWMSRYYCCPLGMVFATMLPAAVKQAVGRRQRTQLRPTERPQTTEFPRLTPSARAAWEAIADLPDGAWPVEPRDLVTRLQLGSIAPINRLLKAGLLEEVATEVVRSRFDAEMLLPTDPGSTPPEPTPAQTAVIDGIGQRLPGFGCHLLHGVTGSGKTEVYLRLLRRVLDTGRTGLVLVPEITLTPQTAGRFLARFRAEGVAVLHSGLSAAERHRQWRRAASGEARVVVGARSAIFAPLVDLGLLIVDEEHDSSYKQDQLPRYNARDTAIKRAQIEDCPVLLGSATPSLESWANTQGQRPRSTLWSLPERVGGGRLPEVRIVDLAGERRHRPSKPSEGGSGPSHRLDAIGPTLEAALRETLDAGGQAILLLNRRGFASYVCCASNACGWVMGCDDCDASMVYHKALVTRSQRPGHPPLVRCHHCLAEKMRPKQCPMCGKPIISLGLGTQRLEEELHERLGLVEGESMLRIDSDTMRSARDCFEALGRFGRGEARVLVGTQMIAKGLDYPNVRLVGVVSADTAINLPDFRASERTFQLVSQVAGRAGRASAPGLVIVQTMNPDAAPIRLAARHDFTTFARAELDIRARAGLPPATRMARIVVRDESLEKAEAGARAVAETLRASGGASLRIQGPMPCPIARVAGRFRIAVELIASDARTLQGAIAGARAKGVLKSDANTAVDIDPVALL